MNDSFRYVILQSEARTLDEAVTELQATVNAALLQQATQLQGGISITCWHEPNIGRAHYQAAQACLVKSDP